MEKISSFKIFAIYIGMYVVLFGFQAYLIYGVNLDPEVNNEFIRINSLSNVVYYGGALLLMVGLFRAFFITQFKAFIENKFLMIKLVALGYGAMLVVSAVAGLVLTLLGVTDTAENQAQLNMLLTDGTQLDQMLFILFAVFFAPIVEELVFRKGLFDVFDKLNIHPVLIVVVSSILFGVIHVLGDDIVQILTYAMLGAVLGTVYHLSNRNIYASISIHMVFNLMVTLSMFSMINA